MISSTIKTQTHATMSPSLPQERALNGVKMVVDGYFASWKIELQQMHKQSVNSLGTVTNC